MRATFSRCYFYFFFSSPIPRSGILDPFRLFCSLLFALVIHVGRLTSHAAFTFHSITELNRLPLHLHFNEQKN